MRNNNINSPFTNKFTYENYLKNLFVDSLFINGYLSEIVRNGQFSCFKFDDIYGVICIFYGVISLYNAVCIQDKEICRFILRTRWNYASEIDDTTSIPYRRNKTTPLIKAVLIGNIDLINIILPH
eukprot:307899_1